MGKYTKALFTCTVVLIMLCNLKITAQQNTQSIAGFCEKALNQNLPVTLINYSDGVHGFDIYNDNETSKQIIKTTIEFWKFYLNP